MDKVVEFINNLVTNDVIVYHLRKAARWFDSLLKLLHPKTVLQTHLRLPQSYSIFFDG